MARRAFGRSYSRSECKYCGKTIAGNMMNYHQLQKCPEGIKVAKEERLERLRNRPIHLLNLGQACETGRMEEFKAYLANMGQNREGV